MKKRLYKRISLILVIALLCTSIPVTVSDHNLSATSPLTEVVGDSAVASAAVRETGTIRDLRKKDSPSYKKGEAVVYMRTAKEFSTGKSSFDSQINIKNVLDFGTYGTSSLSRKVVVVSSDSYSTRQLIRKMKKKQGVLYAEPNYCFQAAGITNDSYSDYQWYLDNQGQNGGTPGEDISVTSGWNTLNSGEQSNKPVVAVIDTGIDFENEDLKNRLWTNTNTRNLKGLHGYDFVNYDTDPSDDNGHGTHVAGIIAAQTGNNAGIAGVSPDVSIMALKFLDQDGAGYLEDALAAYSYIYAAQLLGVNVVAINNSWGGQTEDNYVSDIFTTVVNLVGERGAVSVWAAGNESTNNDTIYGLPASMDSPYLISVAASDENGCLSSFSNYGAKTVDLAAPGSNILSSVSYPCYNPTIYSNEQQAQISSIYQDFDKPETSYRVTTGEAIDLSDFISLGEKEERYLNSTASSITTASGFGLSSTESSRCLSLMLQNCVKGEMYNLAFDYEAPDDTTETSHYYNSITLRSSQIPDKGDLLLFVVDVARKSDGNYIFDDTISGYILEETTANEPWMHLQFPVAEGIRKNEKRSFLLVAIPLSPGNYELQIDDLGISNSVNDIQAKAFLGTYDFESGTSMAAPVVTGALALMSTLHPEYSGAKLRAAICGMVAPKASMSGKLKHEGVLDFDYQNRIEPTINSAIATADGILLLGYFFGSSGTVWVNGTAYNESQVTWSDESILIPYTSYTNKMVDFQVETTNGTALLSTFVYQNGQDFNTVLTSSELFEDGQIFSDGKELYAMTESGLLYQYGLYEDLEDVDGGISEESEKDALQNYYNATGTYYAWNIVSVIDPAELFGSDSESMQLTLASEFLCLNDTIYGIISYGTDYVQSYYIVGFDKEKYTWSIVASLPEDETARNLEHSTFTAYNSALYLIGGYNSTTGTASTMVRKYDVHTKLWTMDKDLPQGRYMAKGRQVGNKLYLCLGGDGTNQVPATLIYDGSSWTVSGATLAAKEPSYLYYSVSEQTSIYEIDEYTGETTYYRQVPYFDAGIGIGKNSLYYTGLTADTYGDVFSYDCTKDIYVTSDYSLKGVSGFISGVSAGETYYVLYWSDMLNYVSTLISFPITSGNVTIKDKSKKGGKVKGAGEFLPGTTTVLYAKGNKGYKAQYFTYDGKKVSGYFSTIVTKDHTVKAKVKKLVSQLKFKKKVYKVKAGKTLNLCSCLTKKIAADKLKFSSSRKKFATVNKKGIVTAKKNGIGKTISITVKTTDGSKLKTSCRIKITA